MGPNALQSRTPPAAAERVLHHGSHLKLLQSGPATSWNADGDVDAIIVPTARPAASLHAALALARALDRPLVVLCSKRAHAFATIVAAHSAGTEAIAVDVPSWLEPVPFGTTRVLAKTKLKSTADTSTKRNLGLLLALAAGWRRVIFLDDDIVVPDPDDVRRAATLLGPYDAVGLTNAGYPDNSVVCHAHRSTGGAQDTFIGGGALAVAISIYTAHFPKIYNEDWLFLTRALAAERVARHGTARQTPYNPFANPRRARLEEFGECLAEGLLWLLDRGSHLGEATPQFWTDFLGRRRDFIRLLRDRVAVAQLTDGERRQICGALATAEATHVDITPDLLAAWLDAWYDDAEVWARTCRRYNACSGIDDAVEALKLRRYQTQGMVAVAAQRSEPDVAQPRRSAWRRPHKKSRNVTPGPTPRDT